MDWRPSNSDDRSDQTQQSLLLLPTKTTIYESLKCRLSAETLQSRNKSAAAAAAAAAVAARTWFWEERKRQSSERVWLRTALAPHAGVRGMQATQQVQRSSCPVAH